MVSPALSFITSQRIIWLAIFSILLSLSASTQLKAQSFTAVCDRSAAVQAAIINRVFSKTECSDITASDVATIPFLDLRSDGIVALNSGDFSGLTAATFIRLDKNSLTALPLGIFEGLASLDYITTHDNPTEFFNLGRALVSRSDGQNSDNGPANFTITLPHSYPFDITFRLQAINGNLSVHDIEISAGETSSSVVTVTQINSSSLTQIRAANSAYQPWSGYISLTESSLFTGSFVDSSPSVCDRSEGVIEAMLSALKNVYKSTCADITSDDLESITELLMRGKNISSLKPYDFEGMDSLVSLDLSDNQLEDLTDGFLIGLESLEFLDLSSNELTSVSVGDFQNLVNLQSLILLDNLISSVHPQSFKALSTLTTLDLSKNELSHLQGIDWPDFQGSNVAISSLEVLRLSHNEITSMGGSNMEDLLELENLHLDNNQLSTTYGLTYGLTGVEYLDLSHNHLTSLSAKFLPQAGSLIIIDLSNNQLTTLSEDPFGGSFNNELERIDLRNNQLTTLPSKLLNNLSSSLNLWVQGNQLTSLPDNIFKDITTLGGFNAADNAEIIPIPLTINTTSLVADNEGSVSFSVNSKPGMPFDQSIGLVSDQGMFKVNGVAATSFTMPKGSTSIDELTFTFNDASQNLTDISLVPDVIPSYFCSHYLCFDGFEVTNSTLQVVKTLAFNSTYQTVAARTEIAFDYTLPVLVGDLPGAVYSFGQPLPDGLTFNELNHSITGVPAESGTSKLLLQGNYADYSITIPITLEVSENTYPSFNEVVANQSYIIEESISLQLPNSTSGDGEIIYSLGSPSDLPIGVYFDASKNLLTGYPHELYNQSLLFTATDEDGDSANLSFNLYIMNVSEPIFLEQDIITSIDLVIGKTPDTIILPASPTGKKPLQYSLSGLPIDVVFDKVTREILQYSVFPFTGVLNYTVTDANNFSATFNITLTVQDDTQPAFNQSNPEKLAFKINQAIDTVQLANSSSGNFDLLYKLSGLPPGLVFDADTQQISGTPTELFDSSLTYNITDYDSDSIIANISITVTTIPVLDTIDDSSWLFLQGDNVSINLPAATGGAAPLNYTLAGINDTVLSGINFNSTSLTITGIASETQGSVDLTYQVTDADNYTDSLNLIISIEEDSQPAFSSVNPSNIGLKINQAIEPVQLSNSSTGNGELLYQLSDLPAGLVFDSESQQITGTPTNFFNGTVLYNITDYDGDSVTANISLTVTSIPMFDSTNVTEWILITGSEVNIKLPSAQGGASPLIYTLSDLDGALLSGLSFDASNLLLSGTVGSITGDISIEYVVEDVDGYNDTLTLNLSLQDDSVPALSTQPANLSVLLSDNLAIEIDIDETKGNGKTIANIDGLPEGLSYDQSTGFITGTPEAFGNFTINITLTDEDNIKSDVADIVTFTLNIYQELGWDFDLDQEYTFALLKQIQQLSLPGALGGAGSFTYNLETLSGQLPSGLSYNSSQRVFSGLPTSTGSVDYRLIATDIEGFNTTQNFSITVQVPAPSLPVSLEDLSLEVDLFFNTTLTAADGDDLYDYSYSLIDLESSQLPDGMKFDSSLRAFVGTPTATGTHQLQYTVTNDENESDSLVFNVTIKEGAFQLTQGDILWRQALVMADQIASSVKKRARIMKDGQAPFTQTETSESAYFTDDSQNGKKYGAAIWAELQSLDLSRETEQHDNWDGITNTQSIGIEGFYDRFLFGVSSSTSAADINLENGEYTIDLDTISPYVGITFDKGLFWAVSGAGEGSVTSSYQDQTHESDAELSLSAVGFNYQLLNTKTQVTLGFETIQSALSVLVNDDFRAAEGKASRIRVLVDVARNFSLENGALITPTFGLAFRSDKQVLPFSTSETGLEVSLGLAGSKGIWRGEVGFTSASISVDEGIVEESSTYLNLEISSPEKMGTSLIFLGSFGSQQLNRDSLLSTPSLDLYDYQSASVREGDFEQRLGYTWGTSQGKLQVFTSWNWLSDQWSLYPGIDQPSHQKYGLEYSGRSKKATLNVSYDPSKQLSILKGSINLP